MPILYLFIATEQPSVALRWLFSDGVGSSMTAFLATADSDLRGYEHGTSSASTSPLPLPPRTETVATFFGQPGLDGFDPLRIPLGMSKGMSKGKCIGCKSYTTDTCEKCGRFAHFFCGKDGETLAMSPSEEGNSQCFKCETAYFSPNQMNCIKRLIGLTGRLTVKGRKVRLEDDGMRDYLLINQSTS
jgi:hypothetical protein